MTFEEALAQVRELLERKGRVSYRALKLQFNLDDDYIEGLKDELIEAEHIAADDGGKVLVWMGAAPVSSSEFRVPSSPQSPAPQTPNPELRTSQSPISYTPPHLAERIRAEQAALEARGTSDGERKTITALFADLKGSTALIEGLDPEEARAIIDPALQLMMDAVHRYEGYVAQALGDGIFALFGAPIAHEDHSQRALYAALRMQEAMRRYADTLRAKGHPPLLMRVGINTGEVVVRSIRKDDLHADYVPVGHSTNLAARVEQLANPGSIVVSAYTHRLTDGYFAFKDLGPTQIKGVEAPLNVYEVLGAGPLRTKLQVAVRRGLTRFVGRHSELEHLQQALEQAKAGHGQIVGVMGEPGLGKSRLFYEFKLTSPSGALVLEAYSVSHGKASPYLPVIELLKSYLRIEPHDDDRTRRQKVIGKVLELDRSLEDTLPYLFALFGIDDQQSNLAQMDSQIRRRRTFDALKKLFLRESLNQPLILIFEDLHWIDNETQGFLDTLSEGVASAKVLLLVNYRPEYRHEWGQKTYYTQLRLSPLGRTEAEEFLDELLGMTVGTQHATPLQDLKRLILEKTEGTPFFMEEIVQELFERDVLVRDGVGARLRLGSSTGQVPLPTDLHIPTTVQGVLAARIDRLAPDEKALLQQLAVIGREFPLSLIRQVIAQPEEELYRLLSSLQRKEFLYEQPAFPEVEYIFKHALTQEVAYGTVLQERRKVLHEQTARAIEALHRATLEDHYSDLAYHYSRSGNAEKAIMYLHLAGQQAVQRSAYAEAITHLTTALGLLKSLPDTPDRAQQELTLQLILAPSCLMTRGYATPEVEKAYARALELCHQMEETPDLFPALWGLWLHHLTGLAEYSVARDLGEQLLSLAQRQHDTALLVEAHYVLATTLFWSGEVSLAYEYGKDGTALYDPRQHSSLVFLYGFDPGVLLLFYTALSLWHLGYPDQALQKGQTALSLAQEIAHPPSQALALLVLVMLHLYRQEEHLIQERVDVLVTFSSGHGFPNTLSWGMVWQGWILAKQGCGEEGIAQIQQGLTMWQSTSGALRSYILAFLAEAQGQRGQFVEGLLTLAEAIEFVDKTGERFYEAELYRLKGTLTLQKFQVSGFKFQVENSHSAFRIPQLEAEECFQRAIEIARRQQAKSLELRAVMSLARLWQQQEKQAEAHQMLAEIYGWFTEGFDTKDLQEAKTLLESLSR
jgi:class 3 adenylate cyclase/predicted ATPase